MSNRVTQLLSEMRDIQGDALRLPLPRRSSLAPVLEYRKLFMGSLWKLVEPMCQREYSTLEITTQLMHIPGVMDHLKERGLELGAVHSSLFIMRHLVMQAPIFTVSDGLKLMLDDTNIRKNIPAKFLAPPFKTIYIEFNPAESRHLATSKVTNMGSPALCEGVYVQERRMDILPRMNRDTIEILELDPSKPARLVELGFTASPFTHAEIKSESMGMPITSDGLDFTCIYIQDENEPISDLIERHTSLFRLRAQERKTLSDEQQALFEKFFQDNLTLLIKALFYIQLDTKEQTKISEASQLEAKIESVAPKKRDKLKRQLYRKYDHIVIGPKTYTPIAQRLVMGDFPKNTKRPHYRSGTFGIRWVGSGQAKEPTLTRIKESIVNEHLLKSEDTPVKKRDYLVK